MWRGEGGAIFFLLVFPQPLGLLSFTGSGLLAFLSLPSKAKILKLLSKNRLRPPTKISIFQFRGRPEVL